MTIDKIHAFIDFITEKELGGYSTPEEKDQALDRASQATFKQMVPYYAENQTYSDALAPFETKYVFTPGATPAGVVILPDNYQRLSSVWVMSYDNETETNKLRKVPFVNKDEWAERIESQLDPVTINDPIAMWTGKGKLQLGPNKPNTGEVWYLKRPDTPKFNYTRTGRVITYNSVGSVQLEWAEGEINNVVYRALQFLGVNMSDEMMVQYTQLKLQDG